MRVYPCQYSIDLGVVVRRWLTTANPVMMGSRQLPSENHDCFKCDSWMKKLICVCAGETVFLALCLWMPYLYWSRNSPLSSIYIYIYVYKWCSRMPGPSHKSRQLAWKYGRGAAWLVRPYAGYVSKLDITCAYMAECFFLENWLHVVSYDPGSACMHIGWISYVSPNQGNLSVILSPASHHTVLRRSAVISSNLQLLKCETWARGSTQPCLALSYLP